MDINRTSYNPDYFKPLFLAEDRHFWFRTRNRMIAAIASQSIVGFSGDYRVLEIGCGTGNVTRVLDKVCDRGIVIGMDLHYEGLHYAKQRVVCPLVQGDFHWTPFRSQFELIGLFDVLEHIPDDVEVLRDLRTMLSDNGFLFLTVPAFPSLWSYFDEASHHVQRYKIKGLHEKLEDTGFKVVYISYFMTSIFPVLWFFRHIAQMTKSDLYPDKDFERGLALNELQIIPVINEMLTWVFRWEIWMIKRRIRLPFGTSIIALAQRTN